MLALGESSGRGWRFQAASCARCSPFDPTAQEVLRWTVYDPATRCGYGAGMSNGARLLGGIVVFVVIFRGILSLLPYRLTHGYDDSLNGIGFFVPFIGSMFILWGIEQLLPNKPTDKDA